MATYLSGNLPALLFLVQLFTDTVGDTDDNVRLDGTEGDDGGSPGGASERSDGLREGGVVRVVTIVSELFKSK
jgi:hypothetical protein